MSIIDLKFLKEAGAHYGHISHKRHPKAEPYILGKQGNIHIINLKETLQKLEAAYKFVYNLAKDGKKILYVCTKPYARKIIEREAKRSKNHYVNFRWLGGTLTNSVTIRQSIKKLEEIDRLAQDGYVNMLKKEISKKEKEKKKLDALLGGIRYMFRDPAAVFIIDVHKEKIALNEVKKKKIPVVALVDTNVNPELVDYPVPGNDDSPKTIDLFCQVISAAAIEGRAVFEKFREDQKQEIIKSKEQAIRKQTAKTGAQKTDSKKINTKDDTKTAAKTDTKKINTKDDAKTTAKKLILKLPMILKLPLKLMTKTAAKTKTDAKTTAKTDTKKINTKDDAKTTAKTGAQKTDSKKINTKDDAKTTAKTGAQKTDSKTITPKTEN